MLWDQVVWESGHSLLSPTLSNVWAYLVQVLGEGEGKISRSGKGDYGGDCRGECGDGSRVRVTSNRDA